MLNFKTIELSDKSKIDTCLEDNIYMACDFSFVNMFAWNAKFKTQYSIYNKTLFLRFEESGGKWCYMMPIGSMPLKSAINMLKDDAVNSGSSFRMRGITSEMWKLINNEFPNEYEYHHERYNDEYIYLSEKLISLSGKKLQSKRNHINRFKLDNPNWEYFPLTSKAEFAECLKMLDKWEDLKDDVEKSLRYDYIATKLMLEYFDELNLVGGAIRVNGQIIAFTIGERLTSDCFVVHVEKAFGEINGAYTIINQQFIQHEASQFKYINREEDMGIESLRKAKMSYQPEILLEEGLVLPISK